MQNFWPTSLVDYAQIVSAIATAGAVIVSLWLASRNPKPRLRAYVRLEPLSPDQGATATFTLYNEGSAATAVSLAAPFVVPRWCPSFLVDMLCARGWVPTEDKLVLHRGKGSLVGLLGPLSECTVPLTVWQPHMLALQRGRLVLRVSHTGYRARPDWVRVLPFVD